MKAAPISYHPQSKLLNMFKRGPNNTVVGAKESLRLASVAPRKLHGQGSAFWVLET